MSATLCRWSLHEMVGDNVGVAGGTVRSYRYCRACRREARRARACGSAWPPPGARRRTRSMPAHSLAEGQVRALRALVGACLECGWTRDAGPHCCATRSRRGRRATA